MLKLTVRYARYVLTALATVGFGLNLELEMLDVQKAAGEFLSPSGFLVSCIENIFGDPDLILTYIFGGSF
jgi:hypothetical protein